MLELAYFENLSPAALAIRLELPVDLVLQVAVLGLKPVLQPLQRLLGAFAHLDFPGELLDRPGQLPGALLDGAFQIVVRFLQLVAEPFASRAVDDGGKDGGVPVPDCVQVASAFRRRVPSINV